ncbi:GspE/PulE family protein [Deinococcus xianganensis]|uniref:Type II/IV secretion system protein n=1 Tax=Deinococcus xianganensis TaxID=1507289 RepID=A0A6I4YUF7_9DEIO|nr:GspE/PulE family protein [Deinococcus xianganensis]MXV20753.1 type II/IV secretion system protein [Deinococcus xianganensis]
MSSHTPPPVERHAAPYTASFLQALARYGHDTTDLDHPHHSPLALARRAGIPEGHLTGALNLIQFPVVEQAAPAEDAPHGMYIGTHRGQDVWAADDPWDLTAEEYAQGLVAFRPQAPATPPPPTARTTEAPAPDRERPMRTVMDALYLLGYGEIRPDELTQSNYQERLLQAGRITPEELAQAYAKFTGTPYISARRDPPHPDVRNMLSDTTINQYRIVPHSKRGNVLTILVQDPTDTFSLTAVEDELQHMEIEVAVASEPDLDHLILTLYTRAAQDAELEREAAGRQRDQDIVDLDSADPNSPVAKRISSAIIEAASNDASDIHFQPERTGLMIRERLHGNLIERSLVPTSLATQMINRLKMLSGMSLESQLPQDNRIAIPLVVNGKEQLLRMRVSSLPSNHGDSIVLRLLKDSGTLPTLDDTGFSEHNLALMREATTGSNGLLLVTGPTGSGKTTLMHTVLKGLNTPGRKISTIEDPIEYEQPRIVQTEIRRTDDPSTSLNFARVLRAILRQDPDIVFVGEIRDEETAETSVHAAQTGHLVLSTLHTNSALATISRLIDLGVPAYAVAETLRVVVSQRLVGRPCPECSVEELMPEQYAPTPGATMLRGTGQQGGRTCPLCHGQGDYKLIPVHEVLPVTPDVRAAIASRDPGALELAATMAGLKTLHQDGMEKVAAHQANLHSVLTRVK